MTGSPVNLILPRAATQQVPQCLRWLLTVQSSWVLDLLRNTCDRVLGDSAHLGGHMDLDGVEWLWLLLLLFFFPVF